jgi:hypothetical protein
MRPSVPRLPLLFTIRVAAVTLTWLANAVDDAVVRRQRARGFHRA